MSSYTNRVANANNIVGTLIKLDGYAAWKLVKNSHQTFGDFSPFIILQNQSAPYWRAHFKLMDDFEGALLTEESWQHAGWVYYKNGRFGPQRSYAWQAQKDFKLLDTELHRDQYLHRTFCITTTAICILNVPVKL